MAHFQKHGRNVHGQTLAVPAGAVTEIGVWGPLDTYVRPPRELDVTAQPPAPGVRIERGPMLDAQNVRIWKVSGLQSGSVTLVARNGTGAVWTQVTLAVGPAGGAGVSPWTVTRASLTDRNGVVQAKYPPSPAIVALMSLIRQGSGGVLRAGVGQLESAGRSGTLYEHTGGVALDIYRNTVNESQRLQAHNLIRFFVRQRAVLGWRNMFYANWGFARSGPQQSAPHHNDHIHIDWMDFSTLRYDGANRMDRASWTELTWPEEARTGANVDTPSNVEAVRAAWNDTSAAPLEDADIPRLYAGG